MRFHRQPTAVVLFTAVLFSSGCSTIDAREKYERYAAFQQIPPGDQQGMVAISLYTAMPPDILHAHLSGLSKDRWNWDADERYSTYDPFYARLVFKTAQGCYVNMEAEAIEFDQDETKQTLFLLSSDLPRLHFDLLTEQVIELFKSASATTPDAAISAR